MKNLVAIVGRPNVGKSTLYNKLIGRRTSIVHDEPGVTRDRLYNVATWRKNDFTIIDTGGIEIEDRPFQEQIKTQAKIAIEEADAIIFVVDGRNGVTNDDEFIVDLLRKTNKPIMIAANKLEANREMDSSIWSLGFDIFPISASHGDGVGDLLDKTISYLDFSEIEDLKNPRISIIGRPNAGKSSLLNALSNDERSIVSPIENTTRDSVNSNIVIDGETFTLIDTAGINKKSKLVESVDHYALSRAINSIENSEITILVIDSERDISHFDAVVAGYAFENNRPIIIAINKWDVVKKDTNTMKDYEKYIRKQFKFLSWAPIVFISALKKERLDKLLDKIIMVRQNIEKRISTRVLNDVVMDIQMMQPAPSKKGGRLQITFAKQIPNKIPTFTLFVNNKDYLHFSYKRYLDNKFREFFGFEGTPIVLLFRNKKKRGDEFNEK